MIECHKRMQRSRPCGATAMISVPGHRVALGIRRVWAVVAVAVVCCFGLVGCDYYFPPPEQRYRAIDVYEDRYEFRFNRYTSLRRLAIALQATPDELEEVNVWDCVDQDRLTELLELLRAQGRANVVISMPDDC